MKSTLSVPERNLEEHLHFLNRDHAFVAKNHGLVAYLGDPELPIQFIEKSAFLDAHLHPTSPTRKTRKDGSRIEEGR